MHTKITIMVHAVNGLTAHTAARHAGHTTHGGAVLTRALRPDAEHYSDCTITLCSDGVLCTKAGLFLSSSDLRSVDSACSVTVASRIPREDGLR